MWSAMASDLPARTIVARGPGNRRQGVGRGGFAIRAPIGLLAVRKRCLFRPGEFTEMGFLLDRRRQLDCPKCPSRLRSDFTPMDVAAASASAFSYQRTAAGNLRPSRHEALSREQIGIQTTPWFTASQAVTAIILAPLRVWVGGAMFSILRFTNWALWIAKRVFECTRLGGSRSLPRGH